MAQKALIARPLITERPQSIPTSPVTMSTGNPLPASGWDVSLRGIAIWAMVGGVLGISAVVLLLWLIWLVRRGPRGQGEKEGVQYEDKLGMYDSGRYAEETFPTTKFNRREVAATTPSATTSARPSPSSEVDPLLSPPFVPRSATLSPRPSYPVTQNNNNILLPSVDDCSLTPDPTTRLWYNSHPEVVALIAELDSSSENCAGPGAVGERTEMIDNVSGDEHGDRLEACVVVNSEGLQGEGRGENGGSVEMGGGRSRGDEIPFGVALPHEHGWEIETPEGSVMRKNLSPSGEGRRGKTGSERGLGRESWRDRRERRSRTSMSHEWVW